MNFTNKYYILILLIAAGIKCYPQTYFQRSYGNYLFDASRDFCKLDNGNIIMLARPSSYTPSSNNLSYLLAVDSLGNPIWSKNYTYSDSLWSTEALSAIISLPGNKMLVAAKTSSLTGMFIKLDEYGNIIWSRGYQIHDFMQRHCLFSEIFKTYDDGIIGLTVVAHTGNTQSSCMLKTDSLGNIQWSHLIRYFWATSVCELTNHNIVMVSGDMSETSFVLLDPNGSILNMGKQINQGVRYVVSDVVATVDNGFVITGHYEVTGPAFNTFCTRFDSTGAIVWSKSYSGNSDLWTYNIERDGNDFVIGGFSVDANNKSSAILIKIDAAGDVLWSKLYGGSGNDMLCKLLISSHEYYMYGKTESFASGPNDLYLVKTDSNGNTGCYTDSILLNSQSITFLPDLISPYPAEYLFDVPPDSIEISSRDTASYDPCHCKLPVADFTVSQLATGQTVFYDSSAYGDQYYWEFGDGDTSTQYPLNGYVLHQYTEGYFSVCLTVTNACGFNRVCHDSIYITSTNEMYRAENAVSFYPNPCNGVSVLRFTDGKVNKGAIKVFDSKGSLVQSISFESNEIYFDCKSLPQGIYSINIWTAKEEFYTGRLMIFHD